MTGNEGNGEPQAPRGDGPRKDRANGNNGNGNHHDGVHGNNGNGPRTGENNPASVDGGNQGNQGTHGNHGNQGTHGNHGNHGGSGDYGHPGNMNTGGPASRGLVDVPGVVHPLGNSLFSVANGVHNALGGDGPAAHRNVPGPPAHANANSTAGKQAPPAPAILQERRLRRMRTGG